MEKLATVSLSTLAFTTSLASCLAMSNEDYNSDTCDSPVTDNLAIPRANGSDVDADRQNQYFLPNVLETWPWPRRLNQYYPEVDAESCAWAASFQAFNPKAQRSFERCRFGLLGCLAYPTVGREHARIACDLVNTGYILDEIAEVSGESDVREQWIIVKDAMHNPHKPRPAGEWIGGEVMRQFMERTMLCASTKTVKRFIETFIDSLDAVMQQTIDRREQRIRDINSYLDMRRNTSAVKPSFVLIEIGLDIPDEVMSHPAIQVMVSTSADMVIINNDMASFNIEQARGEDHNLVVVVMHELDLDLNGAMLWIADFHKELEMKFLKAMKALPQWGVPIDSQVRQYCDGLGSWVRGNDEWNFESERYFGDKGPEIKKSRWNTLIPKDSLKGARVIGTVVD